jgi:DNA-directed RNA polymerase sigma subunit (sigma70/sigma32)
MEKNAAHTQAITTWKQWRKDKDPNKLQSLLTYVDPTVQNRVHQFAAAPLPRVAIEAEAKRQAVLAMQTFNPAKGANLRTHVANRMPKIFRYVAKRQNIGTIPEHRVMRISTFNKAKEELFEKLKREPTPIEMADHLKWSPQEVGRMEAEMRKDLGHTASFQDMSFVDFNRNMETINFSYYSMSPQEQTVYDYSVGAHGKKRIKATEIAKKLGVSVSQVSKIRKKIVDRIGQYTR